MAQRNKKDFTRQGHLKRKNTRILHHAHSLSNNRNNAIGPWYVNSNNGPSNSNGNNWGARPFRVADFA